VSDGKRRIRSVMLGIVDAIAVFALWPDWAQLTRDVTAPHRWLDRVGADRAALTLALAALWCVAIWLAVGLGALAAAPLPGRAGGLARRVASRVLPAIVLRAVAGVAGLGVLVAPVAPAIAGAGTAPGAPPVAARLGTAPAWPTNIPGSGPHIGWPTSSSPPGPGAVPATPTPTWPSTPNRPPTPSPPTAPNPPTPSRPAPAAPSRSAPATGQPVEPQTTAEHGVRVRPGDSLWLVAAHRLGADASDADIAAEWPRWYAANRAVIGDDPARIEPGQMLDAPPASG